MSITRSAVQRERLIPQGCEAWLQEISKLTHRDGAVRHRLATLTLAIFVSSAITLACFRTTPNLHRG